jgi:uncharacterized membrane protein (DUF485 family)
MKTFWFILTITSLVWYVFVTLFVGYKGIADIKNMLKKLADKQNKVN